MLNFLDLDPSFERVELHLEDLTNHQGFSGKPEDPCPEDIRLNRSVIHMTNNMAALHEDLFIKRNANGLPRGSTRPAVPVACPSDKAK